MVSWRRPTEGASPGGGEKAPAVVLPEGSNNLHKTQRGLWKWLTQDCRSQVAVLDATRDGRCKSPGQDARAPGPAGLDSVCDLGPVPSWPWTPVCPCRKQGEVLSWSRRAFLPQASHDMLWPSSSDLRSFNSSLQGTFRVLGVRLEDEVAGIHKPKTGFLWDYQHSSKVGRGPSDIWPSLLSRGAQNLNTARCDVKLFLMVQRKGKSSA